MARRISNRRKWTIAILAWSIGLLMFFPILWTALAAFKSEADAYAMPQTMFRTPWILDNFAEVQSRSDVVAYLRNTVIIAGLSTVLGLAFAIPAAWSMAFAAKGETSSRLNGITWAGIVFGVIAVAFAILYAQGWVVTSPWLGIGLLLFVCIPPSIWVWTRNTKDSLLWILSTKMMPPAGALIPIFLIFGRNGLVFKDWGNGLDLSDYNIFDSFWGMVPLMMLLNLPIMIWMLYTYFKEIPGEILEAARMDGANLWNELVLVLTPMAVPGIASTALLSVILAWNEAFWTLNLTTKFAAPVAFLISEYSNPQGQFWAKLSAASIMAITPILVIGWFSQRQLVRGLTFGAVK
ncbi:sorbitol/mannitol transport system permease protein [Rhizobium aquaticum]|uniref:Sorbitol/mannitol transport system permease protein n=1 Tax=Rhizobium aquaticum TaxID=1549636 RepID=A0ABV2J4D2_9HYPH